LRIRASKAACHNLKEGYRSRVEHLTLVDITGGDSGLGYSACEIGSVVTAASSPSGDRFVDSILDTCSTSMGLGTEVLVAAFNGQSGLPLTSVFPSDEQLDSCFKSRYPKDCSPSLVFLLVTMMSHHLLLSHTRY